MPRKIPKPVQQFRGTTAQHATYTGPIGELTVDTDKKVVVVQDGATAGGIPMAREDRKVAGDNYIKVNGAAKGTLAADLTLTMDMTKVAADLVSTDENNGLSVGTDNKLFAKAPDADETFRLSMIGVPRYWRSTTLPENHVWANGDLVLFSDWPELKKVYDDGGFAGMLLAYNADSATIAANLGKWRPNAAKPTGLYVPKLDGQFFRAWGQGTEENAGSYAIDTMRPITGRAYLYGRAGSNSGALSFVESVKAIQGGSDSFGGTINLDSSKLGTAYSGAETAPQHIWQPIVLYLGRPSHV